MCFPGLGFGDVLVFQGKGLGLYGFPGLELGDFVVFLG